MKFSFLLKRRKFSLSVKEAKGFLKYRGLMFRRRETSSLLFKFESNHDCAITSIFVFFKFLAVWLDDKNKIIEIKSINPFNLIIEPKKHARYLVEIPFNNDNIKLINRLLKKDIFRRKKANI